MESLTKKQYAFHKQFRAQGNVMLHITCSGNVYIYYRGKDDWLIVYYLDGSVGMFKHFRYITDEQL